MSHLKRTNAENRDRKCEYLMVNKKEELGLLIQVQNPTEFGGDLLACIIPSCMCSVEINAYKLQGNEK